MSEKAPFIYSSELNIWTTDDPLRIGHLPTEAISPLADYSRCFLETNQLENRADYLWAISQGDFCQSQVIGDAWMARYGEMYGGIFASPFDIGGDYFEVQVCDFDPKGLAPCWVETPPPFGHLFVSIEADRNGSSATVSFGQFPLRALAIDAFRKNLIALRYRIADTVRLPFGQDNFPSESVPTP